MSQCTRSKGRADILLEEIKGKQRCLAKGQILQCKFVLDKWEISRISCSTFNLTNEGCPNLYATTHE